MWREIARPTLCPYRQRKPILNTPKSNVDRQRTRPRQGAAALNKPGIHLRRHRRLKPSDRRAPREVYFRFGAPPTFLEGVGVKHRMRSGRLTPSRKVGQRLPPLSAPNMKYAPSRVAIDKNFVSC